MEEMLPLLLLVEPLPLELLPLLLELLLEFRLLLKLLLEPLLLIMPLLLLLLLLLLVLPLLELSLSPICDSLLRWPGCQLGTGEDTTVIDVVVARGQHSSVDVGMEPWDWSVHEFTTALHCDRACPVRRHVLHSIWPVPIVAIPLLLSEPKHLTLPPNPNQRVRPIGTVASVLGTPTDMMGQA